MKEIRVLNPIYLSHYGYAPVFDTKAHDDDPIKSTPHSWQMLFTHLESDTGAENQDCRSFIKIVENATNAELQVQMGKDINGQPIINHYKLQPVNVHNYEPLVSVNLSNVLVVNGLTYKKARSIYIGYLRQHQSELYQSITKDTQLAREAYHQVYQAYLNAKHAKSTNGTRYAPYDPAMDRGDPQYDPSELDYWSGYLSGFESSQRDLFPQDRVSPFDGFHDPGYDDYDEPHDDRY